MTTPPPDPSGAIPPGGPAVPGYPPMGYVVVQQPPPPKKNWFLRHKFLTVLAALIVLGVIVMAARGTNSDDSSSTAAGQSTAAQGSQINQPVRDGKFEFVVTDVAPPVKSVGEGILSETAQGQFVVVKLTVRNIGNKAQSFYDGSQKMFDQSGKQYSVSSKADIAISKNIGIDDINPGNSIETQIVFDLPNGAIPTKLELHDSPFSGGCSVRLR